MRRASLLWSGTREGTLGRHSIFAADPYLSVSFNGSTGWMESPGRTEALDASDPFACLRGLLASAACEAAGPWPFPAGAIGILSYDAARGLERIPEQAAEDRGFPWAEFSFHRWAINWDHAERRWALLVAEVPGEARTPDAPPAPVLADRLASWLSGIGEAASPASRSGREGGAIAPRVSLDAAAYASGVREIQERIRRGDCYEVNLSRRITIDAAPDPRRLFASLARLNPAPFAAYIETSWGALVGSSPERFLRVADGFAESRPIKGTAARDADAAKDRKAGRALIASEKNRAENVMIVDLVRNDLGRVCEPGSISVPGLCRLESYAGVHHLVSTVRGRLQAGRDALDVARALFPPGSMTGAPKISAMRTIEELEPVRRGPYAGAAGYFSAAGGCDLSVIIRSFLVSRAGVDLQVGGAVVSDSDPEEEFEESVIKAERALAALAASGEI